MYAIKVIRQEDYQKKLKTFLFSSDEVIYESVVFKNESDFHTKVRELHGGHGFTFLGNDNDIANGGEFTGISLFDNNGKPQHLVVMKAWVFIMLNGKTIDKLTVI